MLFRKIEQTIKEHFESGTEKILLIDGARQVGKTFIVRQVCKKLFKNFVEINMVEDSIGSQIFASVKSVEDFYFKLSMVAGSKLSNKSDTIIFLDEIQQYPNLLTLLKFLSQDGRYSFIASGSLLGVTLSETSSIPIGSIRKIQMFPLDFEEFLIANNVGIQAIESIKEQLKNKVSIDSQIHEKLMDLFRKYLIVGGLPESVNCYLETKNIFRVREIQKEIHEYYKADASKYDFEKKLKIRNVYDLIPSNMENKKKRVVVKDIESKKGALYEQYSEEFDYLVSTGIALNVNSISNPVFPLISSVKKNLVKLYMNDVGILSAILFDVNSEAILEDKKSINLGSVYETVVASELIAHKHSLYYYDNRNKGEVDFLLDDYENSSILPIEVKSGRSYQIHSALNNLLQNDDYNIKQAVVLSNNGFIKQNGKVFYMPVYSTLIY